MYRHAIATLTLVSVSLSAAREPNPSIRVPSQPPATSYSLPNAFGSLTFTQPLALATPPGETSRLFVAEKGGRLKVIPNVTAATPTATIFLDLPALLNGRGESLDTGSESGLLGIAFHPDYAANRHFFVFYSVTKGGLRYQRVSRFTTQPGNPSLANTTSERILIEQRDEHGNHNGGDLHFGPDGFLYIAVGDEGDFNDTPLNSQRINKDFFAGILRIDVNRDMAVSVEPTPHAAIPTDGGVARFAIPKTNPYVSTALGGDWNGTYNGSTVTGVVRREFWATGLRNPWRMSFDPVTGALWCGDVGQGAREEINLIVRGGNYGWVWREGTLTGPRLTDPPIPANFDALYHRRPLYEYGRSGPLGGYSVTGGVVYRGTRIGALTGKYIFGDYGSGNIWSMNLNGTGVQRLAGEGGIAAFGYDPSNQDVLLADLGDGVIRRLSTVTSDPAFPTTLTATGLFSDLANLTPASGLVAYDVNLPFWSDHAHKQRWFAVPDGVSRFTPAAEGPWTLPAGAIWVKHFEMEMQRGIPASRKRIETRLLVKNAAGAYGVSYRWNDAGTTATLVEDAGADLTLNITDNGTPTPQVWRIPSRAECMICHTSQGGHALSFNTRQLNLASGIPGENGNQISALASLGYLTTDPGSPNLLPRHIRPDEISHSVEARIRSYLAVNCSYCHQTGGTAPPSWDGRPDLTLTQTALVHGAAANTGGDPANRLVVPSDPAHSILLHRVAATGGFTRMPPLATHVPDTANIALLTQWIQGELSHRQTYDDWRAAHFAPGDPLGESSADADGDGATNHTEFLAGTHPLQGGSAFRPEFRGLPPALHFSLPVNRSFRIETSPDLQNWSLWDVPANQGLPTAGGAIEIPVSITAPDLFFRFQLFEN